MALSTIEVRHCPYFPNPRQICRWRSFSTHPCLRLTRTRQGVLFGQNSFSSFVDERLRTSFAQSNTLEWSTYPRIEAHSVPHGIQMGSSTRLALCLHTPKNSSWGAGMIWSPAQSFHSGREDSQFNPSFVKQNYFEEDAVRKKPRISMAVPF